MQFLRFVRQIFEWLSWWQGDNPRRDLDTTRPLRLKVVKTRVQLPHHPTVSVVAAAIVDAAKAKMAEETCNDAITEVVVTALPSDEDTIIGLDPNDVIHEVERDSKDWAAAAYGNEVVPPVKAITMMDCKATDEPVMEVIFVDKDD